MTSDNTLKSGFVSLANLKAEVLLAIEDIELKRYETVALQKIINMIRNMNVHYAKTYNEVAVDVVGDLRKVDYPIDLIKVASVGIYQHGEWFSFTRKPNMATTATADGEVYDKEIGEGEGIPRRGFRFGARGFNIGYWVEDDINRRLFIRNYEKDKVILRYRSNGIDCTTKTCVPYQMKDYIVASVVYEFALMRVPFRHSAAELQLKMNMVDRHAENYAALEYEPQNMDEYMDAQWASLNSTVRRGI